MKKITLIGVALFLGTVSFAQITEDFEDGLPDDWVAETVTGDCDWIFTNETPSSQDDFSSTAILYDDDACGDGAPASNLTLLSDTYDVSNGAGSMSFEVWFQEFGDQTFAVDVYDGTDWVSLVVYDANTGGPIMETFDISAYTNEDFQVRWTYDDNGGDWGWGAGIDNFSIDGVLSTSDNSITGLSIFPNPAVNEFTVSASTMIQNVKVFNLLGQIVVDQKVNALSQTLDVATLKSGAYLVQVSGEGQTGTYKLLKQ